MLLVLHGHRDQAEEAVWRQPGIRRSAHQLSRGDCRDRAWHDASTSEKAHHARLLQVTFSASELQPAGICDAVTEMGYTAELKAVRPAHAAQHVARLQVWTVAVERGRQKLEYS